MTEHQSPQRAASGDHPPRAAAPAPVQAVAPVEAPAVRHALTAGPAGVVALQRRVGNRATAALLQRATLNIRGPTVANAGTISGVSNWPHRPPSNLGRQGQHLTAYVAFRNTILSHVRDRTPTAAAAQLALVAAAFTQLPYMETQNQWNAHIHASLQNIIIALNAATGMTQQNAAAAVGAQIDELLAERNRIPGTAISEPGTVGHGEAGHAGALEVMETALRTGNAGGYGNAEAQQAVEEMWSLLDYDPPDPTTAQTLEIVSKRVLTHVKSMRLAFPQVFTWLSGHSAPTYWVMRYLRNNQGTIVALSRVSANNLLLIENYVHTRL
jgi:hypothetical protein